MNCHVIKQSYAPCHSNINVNVIRFINKLYQLTNHVRLYIYMPINVASIHRKLIVQIHSRRDLNTRV